MTLRRTLAAMLLLLSVTGPAGAAGEGAAASAVGYRETPSLRARVEAGELPPVAQRLPGEPSVVRPKELGRHGGTLRMLMGRSKDTRQMVVYGYARLVGYDDKFRIVPDLLAEVKVEHQRVFTLRLRRGHKWSDGHPFTAEDFRYFWEDVVGNKELTPSGPPAALLVNGKPPRFEVLDDLTVRYSWDYPNPFFLPHLAAASPLYIYRPAHYLKQFHERYADPAELAARVKAERQRNWVALHYRQGHQYKNSNPDLPTLQPWKLVTPPPANRFVFERNAFFHRVDTAGRQLPYIDQVYLNIASPGLIPTKVGTGDADLQARNLSFNNFTFLKQGEKRNDFQVHLWRTAKGAHLALFPNLNVDDPGWRALLRNVHFRRALSLAVNRHELNQVLYFGLALEGNNSVLPQSPLYRPEYREMWTEFDLKKANRLLDQIGLTKRNDRGLRLMPDGRPLEIIVETAGESSEQADALELVHDSWLRIGLKVHTKPLQREVFRNRIFAGSTVMSVWSGLENGLPTADLSPNELAPTDQNQLQWPKWGQYVQTKGQAGERVNYGPARALKLLDGAWNKVSQDWEKEAIWHSMLRIYADQVFSIGLVGGVPQPVVVSNHLHNVPEAGIYNWDPGAHFGIYRPDTFWFDNAGDDGRGEG
ncbi:MAG: ABC transporter substrate-binding protein [Hyphomicrobiales bacterium]|nr:ABC transporter substrate-binding protein [Hyphomicrobiales bacterium]MCP5373272.1 ABC transporter substrate-binding protein [Hyphomicrobiales bacterium]